METLVIAKEQNRFSEGCEIPAELWQAQKVKPFTDKACYAKQIVRNDDA